MSNREQIVIRECTTITEFRGCIELQRAAFHFPDLEVSPLRHFIVSREAGGWVLGAFLEGRLVGFVHHLAAVQNNEIVGYSHMTAIAAELQNAGIGARLKWAQRERALAEGVRFIRWTFDPMQARNASFNLNKLGAVIRRYAPNFYGTNYILMPDQFGRSADLDSDRLFAEWELDSARVAACAESREPEESGEVARTIEIPANWRELVQTDAATARSEQLRVRNEFQTAFAEGFVCAGFERDPQEPKYLFFQAK